MDALPLDAPPGQRQRRRAASGAVTASDVADRAGVSVASVSRVLNDSGKVGPAVRERVLAAAQHLGYQPHAAARALASQRSRTIGAVVPSIENPNFAIGVESLQRRLAADGYTLLLASSGYDPDQEEQRVRSLCAHGIDGLVLVGAEHRPSLVAFLRAKGIPFVHTWVQHDTVPSVGFDNRAAARTIANHLLDLGHRDIGVIAGVTRGNDRAAGRVEGVREALRARGLALPHERLIERSYRIIDGQIGLRALLALPRRPTAVICGNDVLAFGALIECQSQRIRVPDDLSVAGFDDLDFASQLDPALTTLRIPADEIGAGAAEHLLDTLRRGTAAPSVAVPVNLIIRGSTAPPWRPASHTRTGEDLS